MSAGAVEEFDTHRGRLFGLAYRLLGSAAEAEDVVQDAFVRWSGTDQSVVAAPSAWLTKVVTNLCLNQLASARARRECYVGLWLPEPVLTAAGALGPLEAAEQRESVSLGLLVLLEQLSPAERAVFVLREAFAYSYDQIAAIVELSEANCRQLHHRARARVGQRPARFGADRVQWQQLVERFLAAATGGDLAALERLLSKQVGYVADGGGAAPVARRAVTGHRRVARLIAGLIGKFGGDVQISVAEVNGDPAIIATAGATVDCPATGTVVGVLAISISDEQIEALQTLANPVKLAFLSRQIAGLSQTRVQSGLN